MSSYPYEKLEIKWTRPPVDRAVLKECMKRSDLNGLWHCLGVLGVLTASGATAYYFYATQQWLWMALALYVHGGLFAFHPQTHEFAHGTVFKTKWLNEVFKRIFGLVHWTSNSSLYWMSHVCHHRYTTHRKGDGEVVLPMNLLKEHLLQGAVHIVNPNGFVATVYDVIYFLLHPAFLRNSRRGVWQRYVYDQARPHEQKDAYWTQFYQFAFHVVFGALAISTGHWFLVVVVSLPKFYGGHWYHSWVHDTMHAGRQPETDDFRLCCRSVRLDPFTALMYWHMEWHTEHHAFPNVPCYNLKKFHEMTSEHWENPMSLFAAWREMDAHAKKELVLAETS
jgi:fatty acid desaturase